MTDKAAGEELVLVALPPVMPVLAAGRGDSVIWLLSA